MAYDERLAERVRDLLRTRSGITERKMFGGLAFLLEGRMCCGIIGSDLMVRVTADEFEAALRQRHARPMDFTGKPMRGFLYVASGGVRTRADLRAWLERGERGARGNTPAGHDATSKVRTASAARRDSARARTSGHKSR